MAFKPVATSGIRSKKYFWLGADWGQSVRFWIYVTTDSAATVAGSGYIDRQDFIDSLKTGDFVIVLEVGSISDSREVIDDVSDGGLTDVTLHVVTSNDGTTVDLSGDMIDGEDGQDAGLAFNFDDSTTMADPGSGDFRLNHATLSSVTAAAIDDVSAGPGTPDVSAYIATWDNSTSSVKGDLIVTKNLARENFAIYQLTGLTDNAGWAQLALTYVTHNGSFTDGDGLVVTFIAKGDKGTDGSGTGDVTGPAGGVSSGEVAVYDDTTGKLIGSSSVQISAVLVSGDIGTSVQAYDADLDALSALAGTGIVVRTGAASYTEVTITAGTGVIVVNGDGVSGNPSVVADLASQGEAETGTDNTKVMTPLRTAQAISAQALLRLAGDFGTFAEKTVPVGADILLIEDSEASAAKKRVQIANLPGGGGGGINRGTPQAASGATVDFTGIPAGVDRVTIILANVSQDNSVGPIHVQLGTSAGLVTTGYSSMSSLQASGGNTTSNSTTSLIVHDVQANTGLNMTITCCRIDGDTWQMTGVGHLDNLSNTRLASGLVTLPGAIDRLSVVADSGQAFDAGTVNIFWE